MTDLQLLFLILALLYLWECACWIPRGSVAFRTWFGKRWRVVHPGTLLGNQCGGFVFAPPLPPLGILFTGSQLPLSLSQEGALAFVASSVNPGWRAAQTGAFYRLEDLAHAKAKGKTLRVKNELCLKTTSPMFALFLARRLRELKEVPEAQRRQSLEKLLDVTLDTAAIKAKLNEFREQTRLLRIFANSLFVYLFVIGPMVLWQFGLGRSWLPLIIGLAAGTTTIAILFRRAHRHLFAEAEEERFTGFLMVLLSPTTAVRAQDLLSRPLLEQFHPIAIAALLCAPPAFEQLSLYILRELMYPAMPLCPRPEPEAAQTELEWRAALRNRIELLIRSHGVRPQSVLEAPAYLDPLCRAYCPRCRAGYTSFEGACDDCGGVALVPLEKLGKC